MNNIGNLNTPSATANSSAGSTSNSPEKLSPAEYIQNVDKWIKLGSWERAASTASEGLQLYPKNKILSQKMQEIFQKATDSHAREPVRSEAANNKEDPPEVEKELQELHAQREKINQSNIATLRALDKEIDDLTTAFKTITHSDVPADPIQSKSPVSAASTAPKRKEPASVEATTDTTTTRPSKKISREKGDDPKDHTYQNPIDTETDESSSVHEAPKAATASSSTSTASSKKRRARQVPTPEEKAKKLGYKGDMTEDAHFRKILEGIVEQFQKGDKNSAAASALALTQFHSASSQLNAQFLEVFSGKLIDHISDPKITTLSIKSINSIFRDARHAIASEQDKIVSAKVATTQATARRKDLENMRQTMRKESEEFELQKTVREQRKKFLQMKIREALNV